MEDMPDTVPELQALVLALRAELADARRDALNKTTVQQQKQSTVSDTKAAPSSSVKKPTMSSLFGGGKKAKHSTEQTPTTLITTTPPPSVSKPKEDADSRRLAELQRVLDEDDIAELRKPMEHPLAAAARRKHLMLNTGSGTVSSLGFGGTTAPKVYPTSTGGGRGVSEEEEVLSLVKQVVEDVSVESRREKLDADDDEFLEAKLRRLQGKK